MVFIGLFLCRKSCYIKLAGFWKWSVVSFRVTGCDRSCYIWNMTHGELGCYMGVLWYTPPGGGVCLLSEGRRFFWQWLLMLHRSTGQKDQTNITCMAGGTRTHFEGWFGVQIEKSCKVNTNKTTVSKIQTSGLKGYTQKTVIYCKYLHKSNFKWHILLNEN